MAIAPTNLLNPQLREVGRAGDTIGRKDSSPLTISLATRLDETEALRPFWTAVNNHPDSDIDFYSYFTAAQPDVIQPFIVGATEGEELLALLPGRLEYGAVEVKLGYRTLMKIRVRQLTFLQQGVRLDRSAETARAFLREIRKQLSEGAADRALLFNVVSSSDLCRLSKTARTGWLRNYVAQPMPCWRTEIPATFDQFLKRRSRKHRYWLRRMSRLLEAQHAGNILYRKFQTEGEVEAFCLAASEVAQNTYQRAMGVGFVDSPETRNRLQLAVRKGWFRGYVLFAGDQPLAFWCGRLYNNVMYLEWTGYKSAYRKFGVGTLLFLKMVERLCEEGVAAIDYGPGASFYKERFGDNSHIEELIAIYAPTLKGLLIAQLNNLNLSVDRLSNAIARKLGLIDRIKHSWRARLARRVEGTT